MRPMRRQDRAVTDPEKIQAVIDGCEICRLGFCDQGKPYVVPVNFGHAVENGQHVFYFHGAAEGRKVDLIRQTGRACIEMEEGYQLKPAEQACRYTAAFRSVIGEGSVREVTDPEEKKAGLTAILRQSTGQDQWTYGPAMLAEVCVCRLDVETLACKEHL